MRHKPLFLFIYHNNDNITINNYKQLQKVEKDQDIVPICELNSYIPNTYNCSETPWTFHHYDTYSRVDSLIYKYALEKSHYIKQHTSVIILEWDVWWNPKSSEWINQTLKECDVAGPSLKNPKKDPQWEWFNRSENFKIKEHMLGIVPFSVVVCNPEILVKASKFVRDNSFMHHVKNCEFRFASAFNAVGARVGLLPDNYAKNIKWHEWELNCPREDNIIHPVKNDLHLLKIGVNKNNVSKKTIPIGKDIKNTYKPVLHVLTVTIRPQHIRRLGQDILNSNMQEYFDLTWAVCFDLDKSQVTESIISYINNLPYKTEIKFIKDSRNNPGGHYAKDVYIKSLPDDTWIWQYDDDNTIHEKYPKAISEYINSHKNSNLIAYWQQDRYTPKKIEDLKCGVTDTAMYTFRAKIGKIADFPSVYGGDGLFLENLVRANGNYSDIIKDVLCKYNTNAHQNSLSEINENKNSSKNAEKIEHKITKNKTAQALIDKSAKNYGKVKDFAIKLSNKMHPTQRVILNVEGSGKAHVSGHLDMTWRPVGKNRMSLFHTKNKSKIGEIIKNPTTGEYLVVLDVFGKTSSTAWIGKEI